MNITIDGFSIRYLAEGQGEDILLLHGWASSLDAFNHMASELSRRFRVIRLDFPGFGESDPLPETWDVDRYAEFTLKFMQALDLKDPIMLGHSFGGRVIFKLAGRVNPKKIVLIDSAGVKPRKTFRQKVRQAAFKTVKWFLTLPVMKSFTENLLDSARSYFGSADYNSASPVMRQTLVKVVSEDLQAYMPKIKAPTLLIWGDRDTSTPLSDAKIMELLIPDAGLCVLQGAGHFSFIDKPYDVDRILESFLG